MISQANYPDHRHSWQVKGGTSQLGHRFEDWQGLVSGLLVCSGCETQGLARLLAWRGKQLQERIYAIGSVDSAALQVFLRNMKSDYCDLNRKAEEQRALMHLTPAQCLCLLALPDYQCLATAPLAAVPRYPDWRSLEPGTSPLWQQLTDVAIQP